MFGYLTGTGALIARRDALDRLRRRWFAGGTITRDMHLLGRESGAHLRGS
jgi:selenocysteine lyase/cysteine desulfurase